MTTAPRKKTELFQAIPGVDRFSGGGALGERFDYHASLFSLPGIFGTELDSIPPVLKLSPAKTLPPALYRSF